MDQRLRPSVSPTLSILIASSGRPTLGRAIEGAHSQLTPGDEVLVSVNRDCPWGHKARNQLMRHARGDYLLFMDDDDVYADHSLEAVRSIVARDLDGDRMHLFRMSYASGEVLWRDKEVRCGNVSTQMVVVPSIAPLLSGCRWGDRYEGDFDFIHACAQRLEVLWHTHVIAHIRP